MVSSIARGVLPAGVLRFLRGRFRMGRNALPVSDGCEIAEGDIPTELLKGWQHPAVAQRQHAAFAPVLRRMHEGKPREDFVALADAVQMTGLGNPLIIEVGCGSGWNSEVLEHFLKRPVRYIGLDYSTSMAGLGKQCYPNARFVVGDATSLPFGDGVCDVLVSGTVLMHVLDYRRAVQESRRVSRGWCVFHTIPVMQKRVTTVIRKTAYGSPVVEITFNEGEFLELVSDNGLAIRRVLDSVPHDYLRHVLGESVSARTYVCEIT